MSTLLEIQKKTAELSPEEKQRLLAYLIQELPSSPNGPDDAEVLRREEEMDSGRVLPISHAEFLNQVGRG